jgi:hypothetical protein
VAEPNPSALHGTPVQSAAWRLEMGRYLLLWMLGVPLPILVLIYAFGGLH